MTHQSLFVLLSLLSGSLIGALNPPAKANCPEGFHNIADHCIQFLTDSGTWYEMKDRCFNVGARMVKVDSDNFMYHLVRFIKNNGLGGHMYWVGASDEGHEGTYRWTDGTEVKMGTPFWGDDGDQVQEPDGGSKQNCAVLNKNDHFFFGDSKCGADYSAICEKDY
ncbi:C-type lectin domain family 17, member A-like [Penaeus japonicus]|uniref:C-type lectin domain family 17, member A-like n=1 Tax=Penaeus japonicus TaxID=27405 RepID=UPI001C712CE4|nr:C-type lectin domain family 17, member A-like [Penaeus japonicus]